MNLQNIINHIKSSKKLLVEHELYRKISSLDDLKIFMEFHIYAVWDFMSLLKALQVNLTNINNPWVPNSNPKAARFINEIVLEEETDELKNGDVMSHFELYISAMNQIEANTSKIYTVIEKIKQRENYRSVINECNIPEEIKDFLNFTFDVIESGEPHKIASAFTFGRENVIPDMFIEIVKNLNHTNSNKASTFVYYLERHIELDGDDHGPIALKMIESLCGDDINKWEDVKKIAKKSIEMRIKLWSFILEKLKYEYTVN